MFNVSQFPKRTEWFEFKASDTEGFRVLIQRVTNDIAFSRVAAEADRTDEGYSRFISYLAEHALLEWEGISNGNGEPYDSTLEHRRAALADWRALRLFVFGKTLDEEAFRGNASGGAASSDTGAPPPRKRRAISAVNSAAIHAEKPRPDAP